MTPSPLDRDGARDPVAIGRYPVVQRIGGGGMGVVYLARDTDLERLVAIKLMRVGFDAPGMRERFGREARAVASLRHPCIVTVFEFGEHEGQPFLVMEYVSGKNLDEIIRSRAPLPLSRHLQLIEDLCRGLHHAHEAGIVHRDVKPLNVMVDSEGTLKLLDFGIAKSTHLGSTPGSGLIGTPRYMSPEQISGRLPVTRRSDIFSVGLVFYELLAGKPAFPAEGQFAVMDAIVNRAPVPLASLVPDLDPRIIQIVDRALEKDVDRRYRDLAQMRREIERIRHEMLASDTHHGVRLGTSRFAVDAQLQELAQRRIQQVAGHLEAAERALESGDFDAALASTEDALLLAPKDNHAIDVLHRVQKARSQREAAAQLDAARDHLRREELSQAEACLRAALELTPSLPNASGVFREIAEARARRDDRLAKLKESLDRARLLLLDGAFESAVRAADEALAFDPSDSQALSLREQASVALEDDRRRRESDRRAAALVRDARRLAAALRFAEARNLLSDPTTADHHAIRQALQDIQAQEDSERARARNDQRRRGLQATLDAAGACIAAGDFESAIHEVDIALTLDPLHAEARALRANALALWEQAQQHRDLDARGRDAVDKAQRLKAAGRFEDAIDLLSAADICDLPIVVAARERVQRHREAMALASDDAAQTTPPVPARPLPPPGGTPRPVAQVPVPRSSGQTPQPPAPQPPRPVVTRPIAPSPHPRGRAPVPVATPVAPARAAPGDSVIVTLCRGGEREWLSDGLIRPSRTDKKGIGVSVLTHVAIVVFVGISLVTQVAPLPIVKAPIVVFVSPLAVARPIQPRADPPPVAKPKLPSPGPTPVAPRATAPSPPQGAPQAPVDAAAPPVETPPAPIEAPSQVLPEMRRPESSVAAQNVGGAISVPGLPPELPGGISEEPVDDVDVSPRFVKQVQPKVPVGATGTVNVEVLVQTNGRVSRVRFQSETPYRAQIEDAAMECVFTPARRRGRPVAHWTPIQFRLETNTGTRR